MNWRPCERKTDSYFDMRRENLSAQRESYRKIRRFRQKQADSTLTKVESVVILPEFRISHSNMALTHKDDKSCCKENLQQLLMFFA